MRLQNKTIIVTGGGSGMGESMCYAFSGEGAAVVVVDKNKKKAELVAETICRSGGKAISAIADVTSVNELQKMVDKTIDNFGKVNVLVNNAGSRIIKSFLGHSKEDWKTMLEINLSGPFYCSQVVVPKIEESGGGSIINVCSIASYMGRPNRCAYVAAKSGLLGLTRSMAIDLASKNIRVNGISPGMIASPFNQKFADGVVTGDAWKKDNLANRWGKPDDINGAAIFLASDESSFITGSDIKVEGGWLSARSRVGEDSIIEG